MKTMHIVSLHWSNYFRWHIFSRELVKQTPKFNVFKKPYDDSTYRRKRNENQEGRPHLNMGGYTVWWYDDHMSEQEAKELCISAFRRALQREKDQIDMKQKELTKVEREALK